MGTFVWQAGGRLEADSSTRLLDWTGFPGFLNPRKICLWDPYMYGDSEKQSRIQLNKKQSDTGSPCVRANPFSR